VSILAISIANIVIELCHNEHLGGIHVVLLKSVSQGCLIEQRNSLHAVLAYCSITGVALQHSPVE